MRVAPPYNTAIGVKKSLAPPVIIPDPSHKGASAVEVFSHLYKQLYTREVFGHTVSYSLLKNNKYHFFRASSPQSKALTYFIPRVFHLLINCQENERARGLTYERPRQFGSKTNILYGTMDTLCDIYNFDLRSDLKITKEAKAVIYSNILSHNPVYLTGENENFIPVMMTERVLIILFEKDSVAIARELQKSGIKKPYFLIIPKGNPSNYTKNFASKLAQRFVSSVIFIADRDAAGLNSYNKCRELIPNLTYIKVNDKSYNPESVPHFTERHASLLQRLTKSSSSPPFIQSLAREIKLNENPLHINNNYQLPRKLVELILKTDFTQNEGGYCDLNISRD
ncbi:hypothetical protein KGF57_004639 [Candida theae]|uniref:Uncharacterized protein n=1 Tax=Candida theae TaxID=1198502 RepID=A0AAD5BBG6_9ASCO|nr:uncharacterized protein KGF57_004639 [Candida theae]KAI5949816.1 hypothetical protein KGF57_004639 [Candida theae]